MKNQIHSSSEEQTSAIEIDACGECMNESWISFFPLGLVHRAKDFFLQVYYELLYALCFSCLFTFTSPLLWSSMRDETSKYYFIMHTHTTKSTKCTRCTISWILTKNTIDWVNVWIYLQIKNEPWSAYWYCKYESRQVWGINQIDAISDEEGDKTEKSENIMFAKGNE